MTCRWFVDCGHGWLRVKKELIHSLGISKKISSFSFQRKNFVYLEEDCDANVFLSAYFNDADWCIKENLIRLAHQIPVTNCKGDSSIRSYEPYFTEDK